MKPCVIKPRVHSPFYPLHKAAPLMLRQLPTQGRNLMESIKTMNWTGFLLSFNLSSLAFLTTPGPSEHPHSALLPPRT